MSLAFFFFFALKSTLSDVNRNYSCFLWIMLHDMSFTNILLSTCTTIRLEVSFFVDSTESGHFGFFLFLFLICFVFNGVYRSFIFNTILIIDTLRFESILLLFCHLFISFLFCVVFCFLFAAFLRCSGTIF